MRDFPPKQSKALCEVIPFGVIYPADVFKGQKQWFGVSPLVKSASGLYHPSEFLLVGKAPVLRSSPGHCLISLMLTACFLPGNTFHTFPPHSQETSLPVSCVYHEYLNICVPGSLPFAHSFTSFEIIKHYGIRSLLAKSFSCIYKPLFSRAM